MLGLVRKAWRDITRRRLRSLLTILAISVGVAGMVAIVSTSRNLVRAQRQLNAAISPANIV